MRTTIVFLSALATSVMGANSTTYSLPAGFNVGLVDPSERSMYLPKQFPIDSALMI
jgi:hypothetical protein